jgi:NAD(P)-dependent dehydrogenase (short-subunit alcohol dehydrogenase family)
MPRGRFRCGMHLPCCNRSADPVQILLGASGAALRRHLTMAAPPALPWRVVWITGASTGIGAEIARQLAARGITVAVSARSTDRLSALAEDNSAAQTLCPGCDGRSALSRPPSPRSSAISARLTSCWRRREPTRPVTLDAFSPAPFRSMYETNYLGVIHVLSAVLPAFAARAAAAMWRGLLPLPAIVACPRQRPMGPPRRR